MGANVPRYSSKKVGVNLARGVFRQKSSLYPKASHFDTAWHAHALQLIIKKKLRGRKNVARGPHPPEWLSAQRRGRVIAKGLKARLLR